VATFRLAHVSDLHLGPLPDVTPRQLFSKRIFGYVNWRRGRGRMHRAEVVAAMLTDLQAQAPDHVIVSGDLVNIALPHEFVLAGEWLRRVGPPDRVTVVPGNHDAYVPLAWNEAWAHWADYMAGDDDPATGDPDEDFPFLRRRGEGGAVAIVGLSSAVASPPTFATGKLGRDQLRRLDALMADLAAGEAAEACRVVVVHHPPVRALTAFRRRLVDDKALGVVLARHGADMVLCGHEHLMKQGFLPGPDGRHVPVVVAPSASLATSAGPTGGYLLYDLERDEASGAWEIGFEHRSFDAAKGAFETVSRGRLGPSAGQAAAAR
jgi:3',5'-cyclic AMP phosphodiesterase CpdA